MNTPARISHCSHWGAYTLLVDDGRIVGVEPFAGDPYPSPIITSVPAWATSRRRVARPMARTSWLAAQRENRLMTPQERARRGHDTFEPLAWDEALDLIAREVKRVIAAHGNRSIFAGSYGWTSCGRFHHAQSLLRRTMNLVGGYTAMSTHIRSRPAPSFCVHVLGSSDACQGRANTLLNIARNTETLVVFGGMSPRTAQSEAGGIARQPPGGRPQGDRRAQGARDPRLAATRRSPGLHERQLVADQAEHRRGADARACLRDCGRRPARRGFLSRYCSARKSSLATSRANRTALRRRPPGRPRSPGCPPTISARSPRSSPGRVACWRSVGACSAPVTASSLSGPLLASRP